MVGKKKKIRKMFVLNSNNLNIFVHADVLLFINLFYLGDVLFLSRTLVQSMSMLSNKNRKLFSWLMFAFNCLNKQRLLSHKLGYKIGSNVKKSSLVSIEKKTFEYENTVCFEGSLIYLGKAYSLRHCPLACSPYLN